MRRDARLRRTTDFDRARGNGRSWTNANLACYVFARDDSGPARIGITVGRRTGNAVVRNRVRRRIREAVRSYYLALAPGLDVLLIARPAVTEAPYPQVLEAVVSLLQRAGAFTLATGEPGGDAH